MKPEYSITAIKNNWASFWIFFTPLLVAEYLLSRAPILYNITNSSLLSSINILVQVLDIILLIVVPYFGYKITKEKKYIPIGLFFSWGFLGVIGFYLVYRKKTQLLKDLGATDPGEYMPNTKYTGIIVFIFILAMIVLIAPGLLHIAQGGIDSLNTLNR